MHTVIRTNTFVDIYADLYFLYYCLAAIEETTSQLEQTKIMEASEPPAGTNATSVSCPSAHNAPGPCAL